MIYVVTYNIAPYHSGGRVFTIEKEAIEYARNIMCECVIPHFEEIPHYYLEIADLSGALVDVQDYLLTDDFKEFLNLQSQLNIHLSTTGHGFFEFTVYRDLVHLINGEEFRELTLEELHERANEFTQEHNSLIDDISHALEWQ